MNRNVPSKLASLLALIICSFVLLPGSFSCGYPDANDPDPNTDPSESPPVVKDDGGRKPRSAASDSVTPVEIEEIDYSKYGKPWMYMWQDVYDLGFDADNPFGLIGYDSLKALYPDFTEAKIEVMQGWTDYVLFQGENYIRVANASPCSFELRAMDFPTRTFRFGNIYHGMHFQEFIEAVAPDSFGLMRNEWAKHHRMPVEYFPEDSAQIWWKRQREELRDHSWVGYGSGGEFGFRWENNRLDFYFHGANNNSFRLDSTELAELRSAFH